MMNTDVTDADEQTNNPAQSSIPVLALVSTFALAAAGTLCACALFPNVKRRMSVSSQVCLGAIVACAGALTWKNRQQELDAARNLVAQVNHARDARWLRKNPVAYA